jgi:hypothetical protein
MLLAQSRDGMIAIRHLHSSREIESGENCVHVICLACRISSNQRSSLHRRPVVT